MRFASACLVSLVIAYTCFGQSEESAPECPKSACATATACPQASHCPSSSITVCAQPAACTRGGACATTAAAPTMWPGTAEAAAAAACQAQALSDHLARHPELLGIAQATPAECNAKSGNATLCTSKDCTARAGNIAACTTGACEATPHKQASCCRASVCDKSKSCEDAGVAVATDDTTTPGMQKCFELNSREATMVTSAERLDHLQKAAEHLAAAGCEKEAFCVTAWADEVKHDLVELMRDSSEMLKEAASELEQELPAQCADDASYAAAECEGQATACATDESEATMSPCVKTTACGTCSKAAGVNCDAHTACEAVEKHGDVPKVGTGPVKLVQVNLTRMRNLGIHLPGAIDSAEDNSNVAVAITDPKAFHELLSVLEREQAAHFVDVQQVPTDRENTFQIKRPESFSHIEVCTTHLADDALQVVIQPCAPETHIPVPEYAKVGHTYCEIDATAQVPRGQIAVLGGHCFKTARVEKRGGMTHSKTITTFEDCQTLFIVTPGVSSSPVKQVSHSEPSESDGAAACHKTCDQVAARSVDDANCKHSACQASRCERSACTAAPQCPAAGCSAARNTACHAAAGMAVSTCPLTTEAQLRTACEAAQSCTAKTVCAACCEKKSCGSEGAACPTTTCSRSAARPSAVACESVSVCPQTAFLAEAVATDSKCGNLAKGACCERSQGCGQAACCRQGEAAMATATDETTDSESCPKEACADAPGASAACAENCDAGPVGVITCDRGVQDTSLHVATGSYLELHLSHLTKAAEHLTEAGLIDEAASVEVIADRLRQELIGAKRAQIAALRAEIADLEAAGSLR